MKHLAIAFVLFVAACGGKSSSSTTPDDTDGAGDTMPAGGGADVVTLTNLSMGDMACYVEFTREDGSADSLPGTFDLCEGGGTDSTALVGQQVTLTVTKETMMADSCEGDPECPDTQEADMVTAITAAAAE